MIDPRSCKRKKNHDMIFLSSLRFTVSRDWMARNSIRDRGGQDPEL